MFQTQDVEGINWLYASLSAESCPVPGQVYSNCSSPCTFTCANVDRISCIALCVKGCGCPSGQVIDEDKNMCVPINKCPSREPGECVKSDCDFRPMCYILSIINYCQYFLYFSL